MTATPAKGRAFIKLPKKMSIGGVIAQHLGVSVVIATFGVLGLAPFSSPQFYIGSRSRLFVSIVDAIGSIRSVP
jgi:hypothetical protein